MRFTPDVTSDLWVEEVGDGRPVTSPCRAQLKPYFETHSVGLVWIVLGVVTALIELSGLWRRRAEATKKDGGSLILLRVCGAPAILLLVFSPRIAPAAQIHPALVSLLVGIVVFASGEGLRIWSKLTLGRYFTYTVQTSSDQPVIQTGPYRFVRHPSYTGVVLIMVGLGAVWGNWLGLTEVTILTLIGLAYRIRVEEAALTSDVGQPYRDYAETHKRLIPYLW